MPNKKHRRFISTIAEQNIWLFLSGIRNDPESNQQFLDLDGGKKFVRNKTFDDRNVHSDNEFMGLEYILQVAPDKKSATIIANNDLDLYPGTIDMECKKPFGKVNISHKFSIDLRDADNPVITDYTVQQNIFPAKI